MDAQAAQRRTQWHTLFPRGRRAIGREWETLKVTSAIQKSNLEKPNFYFIKFRMIFKIAQGQHGNYPDLSILGTQYYFLWTTNVSITIWSAPS